MVSCQHCVWLVPVFMWPITSTSKVAPVTSWRHHKTWEYNTWVTTELRFKLRHVAGGIQKRNQCLTLRVGHGKVGCWFCSRTNQSCFYLVWVQTKSIGRRNLEKCSQKVADFVVLMCADACIVSPFLCPMTPWATRVPIKLVTFHPWSSW